jgi:demethylmenaquinone methyltransferase/2-methoxy-6-polyprenyl-1,4-benzoquinol methylase
LRPFIEFHIHVVIPFLGRLIAGNREAYTYLPNSTEGFLKAEDLAAHMRSAGYAEVNFSRRMFGAVAIHWGKKD